MTVEGGMKRVSLGYSNVESALAAFQRIESLPVEYPEDFLSVEVDFDEFTVAVTGRAASVNQLARLRRAPAGG